MQALSCGQSLLIKHSGRQLGGEPIIPAWQVHWQRPLRAYGGLEFGPQGLGSHGSSTTTGSGAKAKKTFFIITKHNNTKFAFVFFLNYLFLKGPCTKFEVVHMLHNQPYLIQEL